MSAFDPRLLNDCVFVTIASLRPAPPIRPVPPPSVDLPGVARARHMRREKTMTGSCGLLALMTAIAASIAS